MLIKSILSSERVKARLDGASKKRVIETLAKIFANSVQGFDVDQLYQNLINREKLGTTGIGGGIAIPHCRFDTQGETYGACITLESAVDFDAVDSAPVDIIFAMLVPENAASSHLETLSSIAEKLQQERFVQQLRDAGTDDELYKAVIHQE